MRILAFADLHGRMDLLDEIVKTSDEVDLIICAGDLTSFGYKLDAMIEKLGKAKCKVLIIPGNNEDPEILEELCKKYDNLIYLHGKTFHFKGYTFFGVGGSTITPFDTPCEYNEDELREILSKYKDKGKLILVSHSPPYGILDEVIFRRHIGSRAIAEFIAEKKPLMVICGHVHEYANKEAKIGDTLVINPGHFKIIEL